MSIQHGHTLNPVTAIEFFHNTSGPLILAGEGCYLKILDLVTSNLLCECKIFESQAIHGIVARRHNEPLDHDEGDLDVVVWGGTSLSAFSRKDITALLREHNRSKNPYSSDYVTPPCTAPDWILDVAISPNNSQECVLVTAHNTVLRAKVEKNSHELSLESLHSPSRSILYSAHLIWESKNSVLVAAGTVFGEIVVWQCPVSTLRCQVLHTFTGHEGSIFGVNISPIVSCRGDNTTRLLTSCSDDRTIRVWELNLGGEVDGTRLHVLVARETGFGGSVEQGETSSKCLAMVMGHASRIWSVKFLVTDSSVSVLSFGEDATTQYWALEHSKLTHLNTFVYNTGKHLWSKALLLDGDHTIVATGGADSKISLFGISEPASKNGMGSSSTQALQNGSIPYAAMLSRSWDLEEILTGLPSASIAERERTIDLAGNGHLAHQSLNINEPLKDSNAFPSAVEYPPPEMSESHFVNTKPAENKPAKKPKLKKTPKDALNRYAFVSENQVLVTTTFGRVLLGEIGTCITWKELDIPDSWRKDLRSYSIIQSVSAIGIAFLGTANGKIFSYQKGIIQEFGKVPGKAADMFTIYHDETEMVELLVTTLGGRTAILFECGQEFRLSESLRPNERLMKLPERFIVTSAGKNNGLLVLGSRNGSLATYDSEKSYGPVSTWASNPNSGDAITSIVNVPNSMNDFNYSYFLATGRDGTYSIFALDRAAANTAVRPVHQGTPPLGPMIEAAWFSGSELILYGFKSKNFIVWNETKQYEISSVECGGAHRSYDYSPRQGSDGAGYFIYTKASKLYLHTQSKPSHQIIKPGGHGREIKACAVSGEGLIATGAEDTAIRIWSYGKQFDCLAVVQKHTTGIQHLQWHGSYLFSSGGNEEFFIWAVEPIPGFGIGVVCEATCPDQSEEKDLRIMSFDVGEWNRSNTANDSKLLISIAYSDSTIRIYTYSKGDRFHLVAKGRYTSSCLMQLRHLEVHKQELFLLTAATDGNLTVWRTGMQENHSNEASDSALTLLTSHRVHQSSIKSLDITRNHSQIVVATGGDDNALAISVYENLDKVPRSVRLCSAHAAAVTGLSFVSNSSTTDEEAELRIATSGNDQRVREWRVRLGTRIPDITKIEDVFTSVADVGDLTSMNSLEEREPKRVLIVGNGMEVYKASMARS